MHGKYTGYLAVAAVAVVVGLVVSGTPVASLLPVVLLLACPLMMVFMMRSMGDGHGGHQGCGHDHSSRTPEEQPPATPVDPVHRH